VFSGPFEHSGKNNWLWSFRDNGMAIDPYSAHSGRNSMKHLHPAHGPYGPVRLVVVLLSMVLAAGCGDDDGADGESGMWSSGATDAGATSDTGSSSGSWGGWDDTSSEQDTGGSWATDSGSSSGGADAGASSSSGGWYKDAGSTDAGSTGAGPDAGADAGGDKDTSDPQTWVGKEGANPFATVDVGGGKKLVLEKVRIAVRVEGMRVRTLIDHIYKNPFSEDLEGTFRYSLPTESSVSYYAMFEGASAAQPDFFGSGDQLNGANDETVAGTSPAKVAEGASKKDWGKLMEARVHENVAAQNAYETETEKKVDPGLVQQVAPNTFTAKVFPIPAGGRNRVLIAYEQTLPRVPAGYEYAFALPTGDITELDFTLVAFKKSVKSGKQVGKLKLTTENDAAGAYIARKTLTGKSAGGTLVFQFGALPSGGKGAKDTGEADVVAGSDPVTGKDYAVLRMRPELAAFTKPAVGSDRAVFVLDTSRSEHPKRFSLNMELIEGILAKSPEIKQFAVLTFDAGARWTKGWTTNDPAGRKAFADGMKGVLLEGGTDFSAALRKLAKAPDIKAGSKTDADVFVLSDGSITWGGRDLDAMIGRYKTERVLGGRIFAYRTGLGAENLALYHKLTRQGAIFNCMTQADLAKCFVAHRSAGVTIDKIDVVPDTTAKEQGKLTDMLVAGRQAMLYPGASLTLAGRVLSAGKAIVQIHGTAPTGKVVHKIPVDLQPAGELAPRAWAEIAVTQLFDSGADKLRGLAMALSQHYRIASSEASFVVLENENLYKHYKLKEWAAKFTGQALTGLIDAAYSAGEKAIGTWARIYRLLQQHDAKIQLLTKHAGFVTNMAAAATGTDLEIPDSNLAIPLVKKSTIWKKYLASLDGPGADTPGLHVNEAIARRKDGRIGASVRALSTAVELRPGDPEVARMAGYRLLSWGHMPESAAQLAGVLTQRPLEPQSWRDLANAVRNHRPALAALLFEAALSGKWHTKFKHISYVVREEYAMLLAALPKMANPKLAPLMTERIKTWGLTAPNDALRVTVTWNTNNTDIDLWVTDPYGEKCFYNHKKLSSGGKLLDDLTDGFGPERFSATSKVPGKWKVQLHYYANNGNKLLAETYAQISIVTNAGKPSQSVSYHNVVLNKVGDVIDVATLDIK